MSQVQAKPHASDMEHRSGRIAWPLGAHLVSTRQGYLHHGIYVGNGKVIHYAGLCESWRYGPVEEVTISNFSKRSEVWVIEEPGVRYSAQEIVKRAQSRIGESRYRLLTNNCEHLCNWCVHGKSRSDQVRRFWTDPIFATRLIRFIFSALFGCSGRSSSALQAHYSIATKVWQVSGNPRVAPFL